MINLQKHTQQLNIKGQETWHIKNRHFLSGTERYDPV